MLAALVVMVLAATFALVVVAAVNGAQLVGRSDAAAWRSSVLEGRALASAASELRWHPAVTAGSIEGEDGAAGGAWRATWSPAPTVAGIEWLRLRAQVQAEAGMARRRGEVALELRAEPWATGVTCEGDADVAAELVVSGSGVYVGGCLRGRENVRFTADAGIVTSDGLPADGVRSDVFPAAAVHGGVGIYARGVEIHEAGASAEFADDTDRHAGPTVLPEWLEGPSAAFLRVGAEAQPLGPWYQDARLRLDEIPPPAADVGSGGRCIVLPAVDEVVLEGSLSPAAGRLLVVVRGDAVVGQPGASVELDGGLVVLGRLRVRGELALSGPLHARALSVEAPTRVAVLPGWRLRPLAGASVPTVVEYGS